MRLPPPKREPKMPLIVARRRRARGEDDGDGTEGDASVPADASSISRALTRATRRAMRVSATRALCGGVGRGAPRN